MLLAIIKWFIIHLKNYVDFYKFLMSFIRLLNNWILTNFSAVLDSHDNTFPTIPVLLKLTSHASGSSLINETGTRMQDLCFTRTMLYQVCKPERQIHRHFSLRIHIFDYWFIVSNTWIVKQNKTQAMETLLNVRKKLYEEI